MQQENVHDAIFHLSLLAEQKSATDTEVSVALE